MATPATTPLALTGRSVSSDGLLLARIRPRGKWSALRALRAGMAELGAGGLIPRLDYVLALADDGRLVGGRDPDAAVFVLGYTLGRA